MTSTQSITAAILCCLSLVYSIEASANSWRVNYDKRANADFQDLNAAMTDGRVVNGDTLYLDKGCTISSQQTVTKSVTVIGPGYFIGENDADEAYFSNTIFIEASGVKLTGLHTSSIEVRENDAVIERCRVTGNITATEQYENDGAQIRSCFLKGNIKGQGTNGADGWNILNNIFYLNELDSCINRIDNALIDHNTFNLQYYNWNPCAMGYGVTSSVITNNIIFQGYGKSNPVRCTDLDLNNTIRNNVSNYNFDTGGNYPNNLIITNLKITDLFKAAGSAETDSYYARINYADIDIYGSDGKTCGANAGGYPYVVHGYPLHVPRIENLTISDNQGESIYDSQITLQMTIKVQNQ